MKNSHKLLSKFIALFLLTSAINLQAFAFYQDVPSTHPNYQAINVLYTLDKLPKEDSFQPDKLISKEEFYKLIIHYKGLKGNKNIALPYSDIEEGNPYAPYIQKALDLKLLKPGGKSNILAQNS